MVNKEIPAEKKIHFRACADKATLTEVVIRKKKKEKKE